MRHDEIYKAIFSHRVSVQNLLRFLEGMIDDGPEWLGAFDPETLEPVPTERIDETLHRHLSDLVWRVRLRDGGEDDWAYLFVLIEFQSEVDYLMAFRVRTYVNLLYRGLWTGRRFGASDRLPPVLPVVLYNGDYPRYLTFDLRIPIFQSSATETGNGQKGTRKELPRGDHRR